MPLRHVKQIRVVYAAFDPASVGIREFFRRVSASNILSSNPKVELDVDVTEAAKAPDGPRMKVTYSNGEKADILAAGRSAEELFKDMSVISNRIELKG